MSSVLKNNVAARIGGRLPFFEFVAAYGEFPSYLLDMAKAAPDAAAVLQRSSRRSGQRLDSTPMQICA